MRDLAAKGLDDLPQDVVENFRKVIAGVNAVMATWKAR